VQDALNNLPALAALGAPASVTSAQNVVQTLNLNTASGPTGSFSLVLDGVTGNATSYVGATLTTGQITNIASTAGLSVGMSVTGSNIPFDAKISAIGVDGHSISIDKNPTSNQASVTLTFSSAGLYFSDANQTLTFHDDGEIILSFNGNNPVD